MISCPAGNSPGPPFEARIRWVPPIHMEPPVAQCPYFPFCLGRVSLQSQPNKCAPFFPMEIHWAFENLAFGRPFERKMVARTDPPNTSTDKKKHTLEHPSLPQFLPLAQTYCKTRGRHQNTVNVDFFLLRAFFPKPGWSVLQDDRSLNYRKERAEFEVQNERKYLQNESKYPQTSANSKNVTMPAVLWMEEGIWSSVFWGASVFCGVEQKSAIRAYFSRTQKKGHVGCLRTVENSLIVDCNMQ